MIDISKMTMNELISFIRISKEEVIMELINNKEYILNLDLGKLNILYLNLSDKYKKILLTDFDLFDKLMSIPLNRVKNTIIDLSSDDIKQFIYNSKNLINSQNGRDLLKIHLQKLSTEELTKLLDNDNLKYIYKIDILKYTNNNFKLDEHLKIEILNSVMSDKFNPLALFKIKNEIELLVYAKFNLLINTSKYFKNIKISYDFLQNVNKKHILSLIDLIQKKEEITDNNILFISVIKLYTIFGLDNSKKIINDF